MEIINVERFQNYFGSANFLDLLQMVSAVCCPSSKFLGSNCNRTPEGGEATVGYYPLFVTECTGEELEALASKGSSRGSCGKGKSKGKGESGFDSGGEDGGQLGMLDSIYADADQYLTRVHEWC